MQTTDLEYCGPIVLTSGVRRGLLWAPLLERVKYVFRQLFAKQYPRAPSNFRKMWNVIVGCHEFI